MYLSDEKYSLKPLKSSDQIKKVGLVYDIENTLQFKIGDIFIFYLSKGKWINLSLYYLIDLNSCDSRLSKIYFSLYE